ncbi:MAG: hypothetical protein ACRETW_02210, partial [Stenotrophobium sp.]
FLLKFPRANVAVEVKHGLDENAISGLESIAKVVQSSRIADELWVIVEQPPTLDIGALSSELKWKVFTLSDLERKLLEH